MIFGMLLFINAMFGMSTDMPIQEVSFLSAEINDTTFLTVGYAHKRVRPNTTIMVMNSINIINRAEFIYPCV